MSRKRWRTTAWPGFFRHTHQSQVAAYRYIQREREQRALGMVRTQSIIVEVCEDRGKWQTYERLFLDPPAAPEAETSPEGNDDAALR